MIQPTHSIKIIPVDGQPWGRFVNPLTLIDCDGNAYPSEYHGEISDNNGDYYEFEAYADQHQHPFPGATIGDVIEWDKVEVVWKVYNDSKWLTLKDRNKPDSRLFEKYEVRQIYRLKEQPLSEEPEETALQAAERVASAWPFLAGQPREDTFIEGFIQGAGWYKKQQEGK